MLLCWHSNEPKKRRGAQTHGLARQLQTRQDPLLLQTQCFQIMVCSSTQLHTAALSSSCWCLQGASCAWHCLPAPGLLTLALTPSAAAAEQQPGAWLPSSTAWAGLSKWIACLYLLAVSRRKLKMIQLLHPAVLHCRLHY